MPELRQPSTPSSGASELRRLSIGCDSAFAASYWHWPLQPCSGPCQRYIPAPFGNGKRCVTAPAMDILDRPRAYVCRTCGQCHDATDTHLYDYHQPVDDDLTCEICLQPLVDPVDTKCGHTFCTRCIKNYLNVQKLCPLDRNSLTPADLLPTSIIIRRLLDKLLVVCPNVDYCEEVLTRSELEAHLIYRCPGAVIRCLRSELGCAYQGPRSAMESHLWECKYGDQQDHSFRAQIEEGDVCRVSIPRGSYDLGMSIVGGCDTPLVGITVQEIFRDGLVARDGRLQAGDQILEVNGVDLTQATHVQAKRALNQMLPTVKLTVYRDRAAQNRPIEKEEIIHMTLTKHPDKPLGIKLAGKKNGPGMFVMELLPGSVASLDGRLRIDDRILEVNGCDVSCSPQEVAANIIQAAAGKIQIIVSRKTRPQTPDIIRSTSRDDSGNDGDVEANHDGLSSVQRQIERIIRIEKRASESLGISVSGGVGSQRGDTPLYVMNLHEHGCVGRCVLEGSAMVQKGDLLLAVNDISLLRLSHEDAVSLLKMEAEKSIISLTLLTGVGLNDEGMENFLPTWIYWLDLPQSYWFDKSIVLHRKNPEVSFGFSIVGGGHDSRHVDKLIFIKSIISSSPAALDGRLRCGDIILAVNDQSLLGMTHANAVALMKSCDSAINLRVVSWPGTIV